MLEPLQPHILDPLQTDSLEAVMWSRRVEIDGRNNKPRLLDQILQHGAETLGAMLEPLQSVSIEAVMWLRRVEIDGHNNKPRLLDRILHHGAETLGSMLELLGPLQTESNEAAIWPRRMKICMMIRRKHTIWSAV